ncbi:MULTISPECIES: hypothetical protein [Streptomyces]|uniref:hypothetical protein n=1 Tax=Streptomyces TaxID=1883 RepID=UPI00069AE684|nr:hypothetical protein [Streptomyces sp. SID7805]MYU54290.1 hypothetical protein [Streptomyces sp. SID7805]
MRGVDQRLDGVCGAGADTCRPHVDDEVFDQYADDRAHAQVRRRVDEPVYRREGVVVRCVASSVALFSRVNA